MHIYMCPHSKNGLGREAAPRKRILKNNSYSFVIQYLRTSGRRADAVGDREWDGLGGAGVFAEGNRLL